MLKRFFTLFLGVLVLSVFLTSAVSAQTVSSPSAPVKTNRVGNLEQKIREIRQKTEARIEDRREKAVARLEGAKLRACEARHNTIVKRSEKLGQRVANMINVFAKIAERVDEYYQNKLVPKGITVENYDALVSDVASKKIAIEPLVAQANSNISEFSCDSDNPAEQIKAYNSDMRAVLVAIKEYKTSVRNLIVAIRSATGAERSSTGSAVPNIR